MISKNKLFWIFLLVIAGFVSSCDSNDGAKSDFEIVRYDRLLFNLDTNNLKSDFENLKNNHPDFTDIYFNKVVLVPGYKNGDSLFYKELKLFITDSLMLDLESKIEEEYGDMNDIRNQFGEAFINSKKIFKDGQIPRVYSYISGFAYQKFIFDIGDKVGLAFGLDMFLGNKVPYKYLERGQNTFSDYFIRTYNKEHLVRNVLDMWIDDKLGLVGGKRAIDLMIKNGKKLNIIKELVPEIQDSVLLLYSANQLEWLGNNEKEMWSFFIKHNYFYTTDSYVIKRLTSFSPNSQALGMPIKSPGFVGNYLGYRIVDTYLKRNPELSTSELINDNDAQKILEKSRFKPKSKK